MIRDDPPRAELNPGGTGLARRHRLSLTACLTLLVLAFAASAAQAQTITVTTLSDELTTNGLCSLREAITNANAHSQVDPDCPAGAVGSNTITFNRSGTITLGSALPSIGGDLVVDGSGQSVTIDGAGAYQIFTVGNNESLTLHDLTVTGGTSTSLLAGGAAIEATRAATITITNCHLHDNNADGQINGSDGTESGGYGGAIYIHSGSLSISDSTFVHNFALQQGGAIYAAAAVTTIKGTSFYSDTAGESGGAVETAAGLSVDSSTFTSETAITGGGGAIEANGSTLTITGSTFTGNSASGNLATSDGGAVNAVLSGPLAITGSTFANNTASFDGGAISSSPGTSGKTTTLGNDTFTSDNAGNDGGGLYSGSTTTIAASTLDANSAASGGDVYVNASGAKLTLHATILAASSGGHNCASAGSGAIVDGDYNISDDGSCALAAAHSLSSTDPGLDPAGLAANGGPTETVALVPGSPAIDAVPPQACTNADGTALTTDERGYARPADGNLDGIANCDIGAYEYDSIPSSEVQRGPAFTVTTTADTHGAVCLRPLYGSACSLHDAIMMANAYSLQHHKQALVQPASGATYDLNVVDNSGSAGANALPVVIGHVLLNGSGATIERDTTAPQMRLLQIAKGADLRIADGTFAGGDEPTNGGGLLNAGTLTLVRSFVHGNTSARYGGALFNARTATVHASTFSANTATAGGGAIFNQHTLQLANSTLTGNTATRGGAIASSRGSVTLINATLSFDSASQGAQEVAISAGSVSFANTIAGYTVGATNCAYGKTATHKDAGNNIDSGTSCKLSTTNASLSNTSPGVGALADYGGPTPTMQLKTGSPAINAGNNKSCTAAPINNLDQRDITRITTTDPICDIGAFEYQS